MEKVKTPWGEIGYIVYKRTYARPTKEKETEEFEQTVDRCVQASVKQLKVPFSNEEQSRLKDIVLGLKGTFAGRFFWQLGTKTVDRLGLLSLQNCAAVVVNEPITPFLWTFDALMLGSGVGYNIQREYVYEIPKVKRKKVKIVRKDTKDADFIVPDSREGWTELLKRTLEASFYTGKGFSYSTVCIRGKGEPIVGFGGVASGPNELCYGIEKINEVLNSRSGKKLRPIDCLDIMNIIGYIVVSGNVRRSAQIAIGDYDDLQFLNAKRWDLGNIPAWRAMSNNSVVCNDFSKLPDQFWEGYKGNGEPYGLINLNLSRRVGRLGETEYPDADVVAYNPCQPSFATVLTREGVKTFKDIDIGSEIWSNEGWTKVVNKWSTGVKSVNAYRTSFGTFIGTENHRLVTSIGKVEADQCEDVHVISGPLVDKVEFDPNFVMTGLLIGDGYNKKMKGRDYTYPVLCIGNNDCDYFDSEVKHLILNKFQDKGNSAEYRVDSKFEKYFKSYDASISKLCKGLDNVKILSLLRGLYSADGSVIKQKGNSVRVTYKTASKTLVEEVQLLLSSVGIRSYVTTNKAKTVKFANGEYMCKESYDLNITRDFREFYSRIGFLQNYKMDKIRSVLELYSPQGGEVFSPVREVEYLGEFEVFDITVDNDSHTYWTGGLNVSNCAEQSLNNYETCVTGDTLIQTESGVVRIKEVVGKKVKIFNGDQWSEVEPFLANPKDEFLKITFSDGSFLKATKYHEFSVSTPTNKKVFKKLRADELEVGMYLPKFELDEVKGVSTEYAYTLGAFTGDGYLDNGYPMLCAVEGVKDILFSNCKISSENRMWKDENRVNYMYRARIYTKDFQDNTLWKDLRDSSKGLPNYIMSLDRKSSLDFIAGWIDTDGSIRNKATKGEGFAIFGSEYKIRDAQLLCRRAGINYASVWRMSKAGSETNYGIRNRDIYVLQIPSFECGGINTRLKKISNISERYKVNNAYPTGKRIDTAPRQQITGIEVLTDKEASYCFSEPLKNMGVFGNVLTYQCCLAELHLPNINTQEELFEVAQYLYRVNKHSLALDCHHKETEAVVHRNMRMGIGVTGYLQATEEQRSWLPNCYTKLREFDKEYSARHGFPTSIKLTTVKPSGTLSLLSGVTSGGHPAFSRYYIRRVRIASNSELVEVCRRAGYNVEWVRNFDGTEDKNTVVIEFPCRVPDHAVLAEEIGAVKQMEVVKRLQSEWSDNAVSVTVYYKQEELQEIRAWLAENFNDGVKTISFLLHSDHGFDQAPMEAISKERYEELKAKVKPIESVSFEEGDISSDQIGCVGGVCPIK